MAAASDKDKKQVMDVAKPGSTGATPTARPIIVSHTGMMKDPMMATQTPDEAPEPEKSEEPVTTEAAPATEGPIKPATLPSHKVIQPISAEAGKSAAEKSPDKDADEPAKDVKEDVADVVPESSDEAVVDAVVDQVALGKKKENQLSDAEKKQEEAIEKLVEDKTYFVPIGQVRRRRRRYVLLAILFVTLLVAGAAAYAYQTGLIKLNTTKTEEPAAQPSTQQQPTAAQPTAPKLTEFSSQEVGFKFSYPTDWGTVTIADNTKETTETSKRLTLAFTKEPKVTIGSKTAVWKDSSKDVNRSCAQPGFIKYVARQTALDNGIRVVSEKTDRQVVEELTGGLCSDKALTGNVKFTKNTGYVGAQVLYQDKVDDNFDLAQRITDYKKDYSKYFSDTLRQQIIELTNSIQEL